MTRVRVLRHVVAGVCGLSYLAVMGYAFVAPVPAYSLELLFDSMGSIVAAFFLIICPILVVLVSLGVYAKADRGLMSALVTGGLLVVVFGFFAWAGLLTLDTYDGDGLWGLLPLYFAPFPPAIAISSWVIRPEDSGGEEGELSDMEQPVRP